MPPVEEWKRFRFGHDMNNILAQVIHPVDRPLQANLDANGTLLPVDSPDTAFDDDDDDKATQCVFRWTLGATHILSRY